MEKFTTHQDTVPGTRSSAALNVAERRHARVEAQFFGEDVLDVFRADGVEAGVLGTLGDDDDRLALAYITVLFF